MDNIIPKARTLRTKNSAFTLIELLVVIAIIGILAGLIISGTQGAMDAAKRAETMSLITSLKNAIVAYETEYGYLPDVSTAEVFTSDSASGQDLVEILTVSSTTAAVVTDNNPRLIRFVEFSNKNYLDNDSSTNELVDAWDQPLTIGISNDYQDLDMGGSFSNQPMRVTVAVASPGKENSLDDEEAIKTW